jgi:hypothetical protein
MKNLWRFIYTLNRDAALDSLRDVLAVIGLATLLGDFATMRVWYMVPGRCNRAGRLCNPRRPSMSTDELFVKAIEAGCQPIWHDGIFGPAWHCGCDGLEHACDQQCSMITEASIARQLAA